MKTLTILFLIILNISAYGTDISNKLSENHVNVPGTKVSIIPPYGFTPAKDFNGFQQTGTSSSIMIIEIPGPYSQMTLAFTKSGLKAKGVIMSKKEKIKVGNDSAVFIVAEQFANETLFNKYILVFGNDSNTVFINSMYPKDFAKDMDEDIKKSLFSVVYEQNKIIDPLANIGYTIDATGTKLKFAKVLSNSLMYTADGKVPTESDDRTLFVVASSLSKIYIEDRKKYTIDRLNKLSKMAYGINKKFKEKEMIYMVMLYSDNLYYLFIGSAKDDFENNHKLFVKLAKTFERK